MMEKKFISLIKSMTEEEQQEMLQFIEYLHKRREEGNELTEREAFEMGVAARKRLRK